MTIPSSKLPLSTDPAAFRERGYTVVRELFGAEEVQHLRAIAQEAVAQAEREHRLMRESGPEGTIRGGAGDLLSNPSLRHVLLDPRVLGVVSELLGDDPQYFGDSTFRIGSYGARGWHRDCVNRRRWRGGPDWEGEYPILRCGLYLQDSSRHSGGVALRPRSNRPGLVRPTLAKLVDARPGDLVVWQLRTVHSGEVVRMRALPVLPLHPRLQTWLPMRMRVPDDGERIVMFMTFGARGDHLEHYIEYLRTRDYMQASWASSRFEPEVWELARQAGLHVLRPIAAYGAPVERSTLHAGHTEALQTWNAAEGA